MVSVTIPQSRLGSEQKEMSPVSNSPLILRQFASDVVKEAFRQRAAGNNTRFEDLRRGFASKPSASDATSSAQLEHLLVALTQQVSLMDTGSISLVKTIVAMNWLGRSESFVQIYIRFLGSLVSSHAEYSTLIIRMLVQHLALVHHSIGRIPNHHIVDRSQIYSRVHAALCSVLDLVPFARENLVPIIVSEFPHKSEKVLAQTTYVENVLQITRYVPSIEGAILGVIIDKIISIDVEIQVDLEDLESDEGEEVTDGADGADLSNDEGALVFEELSTDEYDDELMMETVEAPSMTVQLINENIRKLDSVITILMEHLDRSFSNLPVYPDRSSPHTRFVVAETTFESLLRALDHTILKTYQSKYTQFILFWAAQTHRDFTDQFLGVILERALDHSRPSTHRMIAASYIGSFTARASTLDRAIIRTLTTMIAGWINGFLDAKEGDHSNARDAVKKYGVFYAMIQALFYIFCFRWRELVGVKDSEVNEPLSAGVAWLPGLQRTIERAIYHRTINPLKYCNSTIITQFAKISHHLDFVFCGTIIESNKRSSQHGVGEIDSYFPFDPYELKRSRHYIDGVYSQWQPLVADEDEDLEDESDIESNVGSDAEE